MCFKKFLIITKHCFVLCVIFSILLSACSLPTTPTPTAATEEHYSDVWYVATDGDDSNTCDSPSRPCLTLNEVLNRVTTDDEIHIGPGTYTEDRTYGSMYGVRDMNLSIQGAGPTDTVLDGGGVVTVLQLNGDSRVTLSNLTLQNGGGHAPGNCLSLRGTSSATVRNVVIRNCTKAGIEHLSGEPLQLTNVTVEDSQPDPELGVGYGGDGVYSGGNLVVDGGDFINNAGTGFILYDGTAEIRNAHIEGNGLDGISTGGTTTLRNVEIIGNDIDPTIGYNHAGVLVTGGDASVSDSEIRGNDVGVEVRETGTLNMQATNVSEHPRQGLVVNTGGQATLQDVTISDNGSLYTGTSLPGGIANGGHLTIRESIISGNHNGSIRNDDPAELFLIDSMLQANEGGQNGVFNAGTMVLQGSTIADDLDFESAIRNQGSMTMLNTTISGNSSWGLLAVNGSMSMAYVTITDNQAGIVAYDSGALISLIADSLIVGNTDRGDCVFGVVPATPALSGENIDSDGSCSFPRTESLADIHLGPLADNGGPTLTHALMPGSVAIDAATGSCPPGDQRGFARPGGAACDVGAYETGTTAMAITAATPGGTPDIFEIYTNTPPAKPLLTFKLNAFCRIGPGTVYPDAGSFEKGQQTQIDGRNDQDPRWWWVQKLNSNDHCWVSYITGDTSGPVDAVPLQAAPSPPPPTKASQPQNQPQGPACSQINDAKQCINAGCKWSPNNVCISK